jgi:hypothetical protein
MSVFVLNKQDREQKLQTETFHLLRSQKGAIHLGYNFF